MRTSMRLGVVGSGVALLGSAAFGALAPSAGAASGQARTTPAYNSTASAEVNNIVVGDTSVKPLGVTATTGNSPKSDSRSLAVLLQGLENIPVLGSAVGGALGSASPSILELASVHATAGADGVSTACATTLQANCDGTASPVTLKITLDTFSSILDSLPVPVPGLSNYALKLTLQGPQASCEAGPAGSGKLSGRDTPASVTAEITENDAQLIGPVDIPSGQNIWDQLATQGAGSTLADALHLLASDAPLNLTLNSGSQAKTDSKITVTSGLLGLSTAEHTLLKVGEAKATCGPNTRGGSPKPGPGSQTGGEKPLGGIQSDEGRSSVPAASWRALSGMP